MRLSFLGAIGVGAVLLALPVQAQTATQVERVVEALRQASKPEKPTPGLYSDWQVKPENVQRWSRQCLQRELSIAQFQSNVSDSRAVVTCVVKDAFKDELQASKNNEALAVQRVAAWWLTGDPNRYDSPEASPYVKRVLSFYQPKATVKQPATKPTPAETPKAVQGKQSTFYDRYMQAGYTALQKKDAETAQLYFNRALDERPNDKFAQEAMRSVEALRSPNNRVASPTPSPAVSPKPRTLPVVPKKR